MDTLFRRSRTQPVAAVFIHAGAGYHSHSNQHIHLGACESAARMAMRVMKAGGSAVDAIEAAIKVLEDKEITNAGYGSNLAIDGVVECDATIVDHLGRSGACGATAQIKNPIHLARTILDASNKPLSLRRVPPNLLVGQGATDFAWEQGISVVPHDVLISRNAKDRYLRWREDLKRAEGIGHGHMTPASSNGSTGGDEVNPEYEEAVCARQRRDHTQAILYGTWNEGQPPSPSSSPQGSQSKEPLKKRPRYGQKTAPDVVLTRNDVPAMDHAKTGSDGNISLSNEAEGCRISLSQLAATRFDKSLTIELLDQGTAKSPPKSFTPMIDAVDDHITDTVGAIAIDMFGHIAAGSSSGGIGMKHRGRVGPAALVGIGSAVIPANDHDPDGICVAAVTSGTGEHMATTMASQKCAERLYYNARQAKGGHYIPATEDEAMESFVTDDFMGHPGVRDSSSAGAIGVMAVKKTPCGYFLHFAHNTESFALASMHSNERDAKCVMSRMGDDGKVVRGARKIRID